jgi:hypothetical protein
MAKQTLTDRINSAIRANNSTDGRVPMGKGPVLVPARTYVSPTDAYDDEISQDSPIFSFAPGANRGMWVVLDQQHATVPVTQLTSSGETQTNFFAAIQGGIAQNPQAPATTWAAVPSMIVSQQTSGPVIISANVSVQSSAVSDTVGFAIYRDGQVIGNHLTHTLPATASASSLVQLNAMDNPPSGQHTYALYWSPGAGTLVATSNQRNLYAINLTPS